jgi:glycosyltransferase involved in cell wall biosynthesis
VSAPLRVTFAFASRGIGGAERSMLRLMAHAHPRLLDCRVIVASQGNQAFRNAAAAAGVPYDEVSPRDLRGWGRLLRRQRPDLLYVFGRFRTLLWAAQARRAGVRCIVAAERSAANRWSDALARRLDRPLVTAYIANTESAAGRLRALHGPGGPPVWVVPNGIEGPIVPLAPPSLREPSVLCVGNITPNKGQGVLLEAVRLLRGRHPGLRATLVGRDFTHGRFFRQASARGLGDTYVAAGFVDDVRPYLALATVVVLPTLHREGMPTSLLEAMRAGVPVVASRVGGVGEVVEDGHTGILVTPGDAHGLAEAVGRLLDDEDERRRLAENARRFVVEHHDISVMVEGHRAAFRDALALAAGRHRPRALPRAPRLDGGAALTPAPPKVAHVTTADVSLRYLLLGQLAAIRDRGYDVAGVSSPGPDMAALETHGIPHRPVAMTRRLTPLQDLRSLLRLFQLMRRERFTIVHTHNPKPGLLGQIAARLAGVPVVVNTLHGFYFHERMHPLARRFYVALERIAGRCSDVILSQNAEDVETALREGIARPGQIRHLGNGIDLARFDPSRLGPEVRRRTRAALGIPENAPVVGFVGRLVREKGVVELLQAARSVLEMVPEARFVLVGGTDGEKADRVTPELARQLGVEYACVFAGQRQDMPEMYRAMDVFVLPSYREGFPRAPMEAAAMKLPCVVTDVRGCRQAVTHERNGLLVPVGDAAALAEAVLVLLADPARARRLGEEGRRRALQEFDEQRVFAAVLGEYDRLLGEKGLASRRPPSRVPAPVSRVANR